jgi:hypothetical protein
MAHYREMNSMLIIPKVAWERHQGSSHTEFSARAGQLWLIPVNLKMWDAEFKWIII